MGNYRGAVIGIQGIGKWHGEMMRDTGCIDVVALCDVNQEHKAAGLEKFPEAAFYTSHTEMLAAEQLDLVAVATPHNLHAPLAIDALNAGANVITEKPMATTYQDCVAMIEAGRANDRFVTVFHNRRLDTWFLAARDVMRDGLLGAVIEINVGIAYAPSLATWRGYKEASGGLMFDWGAHLVDYALHFDESAVQAVSGVLTSNPDAPAEANELHGTLRVYFASGTTANVIVSAADRHCPQRYKIIGTKGTLVDDWSHAPEGMMKVYGRLSGGEATETEVAYRQSRAQDLYDSIAARLRGTGELMVSAESSAQVINVLCTAERSSKQGGVPLPLAEK